MEIIQTCCGHPFYLYYLRFVCWKNNNLMVYSFENFGFGYLASILLPAGVVTKVTFANLHINWKNTMYLIYIYLLLHILSIKISELLRLTVWVKKNARPQIWLELFIIPLCLCLVQSKSRLFLNFHCNILRSFMTYFCVFSTAYIGIFISYVNIKKGPLKVY